MELIYTSNIPVNYDIYELEVLDESTIDTDNLSDDILAVSGKEPLKKDESGNPLPQNDITMYFSKMSEIDENGDKIYYDKMSFEDVTESRLRTVFGNVDLTDTVNKGTYELYRTNAADEDLSLVYNSEGYDYDYYLSEISWKDENIAFDNYTKETDLIYVVVNAKQPEPQEQD